MLWPPSGRLVRIGIAGVTDADGDAVAVTVTGITQDEPPGDNAPDARGIGDQSALVRAERRGTGNGRVYRITFSADDGRGGTCTGAVTVCVPHDRGNGRQCDEGRGRFASGGSVPRPGR